MLYSYHIYPGRRKGMVMRKMCICQDIDRKYFPLDPITACNYCQAECLYFVHLLLTGTIGMKQIAGSNYIVFLHATVSGISVSTRNNGPGSYHIQLWERTLLVPCCSFSGTLLWTHIPWHLFTTRLWQGGGEQQQNQKYRSQVS